jgi:hypothetical protein
MKPAVLTYHALRGPQPGEYLRSMGPKARACYRVLTSRKVKPRPGTRRGPVWRLECERIGPQDIPPGAVVHPLYWFKRSRRERPGEREMRRFLP